MKKWLWPFTALTVVIFVSAIASSVVLILSESWVTRILGAGLVAVNGYNFAGIIRSWKLMRDLRRDEVLRGLREMP